MVEHSFGYNYKSAKNKVEILLIWQNFLICSKHRAQPFLIFALGSSQIKNYIEKGLVSNVFNVPCKRLKFSL